MPAMVIQRWQVIVVALAGWLNRQQQDVLAYLREENRVLRWYRTPIARKYDGSPLFTREFTAILKAASVKTIKLPPRSPNLSPHAERFVRSIKSECLAKMIFFGER